MTVRKATYDDIPWYTGLFEKTFQDILEGCEAMLDNKRS